VAAAAAVALAMIVQNLLAAGCVIVSKHTAELSAVTDQLLLLLLLYARLFVGGQRSPQALVLFDELLVLGCECVCCHRCAAVNQSLQLCHLALKVSALVQSLNLRIVQTCKRKTCSYQHC
jgi:hypothetical protein